MKHDNQVTLIEPHHVTEVALHEFVAEASDLRLPPEHFPKQIPTALGNRQPFLFLHRGRNDEAIYIQSNGIAKLTVYND